ncbi:hypothetical protein FOVSG1_004788 [Fusarium oxysporum f. sp. vasinfectum]
MTSFSQSLSSLSLSTSQSNRYHPSCREKPFGQKYMCNASGGPVVEGRVQPLGCLSPVFLNSLRAVPW